MARQLQGEKLPMSEIGQGVLPKIPVEGKLSINAEEAPPLSFDTLKETLASFAKSDLFIPSLVLTLGVAICYWPLLNGLPKLWLGEDGYYSHGFLIPFLSGYIIYLRWPRFKDTPVKPSMAALVVLVPLLWVAFATQTSKWDNGSSLSFLATILCGIAFVAGWRWAKNFVVPVLYLAFCLPMWSLVIDNFTAPLQQVSTVMSTAILNICQLHPISTVVGGNPVVYVGNFALNIAIPCSGLKLLIAVTAFALLFIAISNLKWWARFVMVGITLPLCIFINGLRIALIGIVGDMWGDAARHTNSTITAATSP